MMSRFAPDTTKNSGMRNPNPMASILACSEDSSEGGENRRTMMPATKAPSTTSRPKSLASASSVMSSSMVKRSAVWELV